MLPWASVGKHGRRHMGFGHEEEARKHAALGKCRQARPEAHGLWARGGEEACCRVSKHGRRHMASSSS